MGPLQLTMASHLNDLEDTFSYSCGEVNLSFSLVWPNLKDPMLDVVFPSRIASYDLDPFLMEDFEIVKDHSTTLV